jgi:hypothetical protein
MSKHRSFSPPRAAAPALALALAGLLAGCAAPTPQFDARFGDAVRSARAQQVVNPGAAANTDPVRGLDGQSARAALERYQKSFAAPAAQGGQSLLGGGGGQ